MPVMSSRLSLVFTSVGHLYSHLFMLLYATVVLALESEFDRPYGEMLVLSLPGFIAFGVGALPAGWLGDRWSATGMMVTFFVGTGFASILTGFARTPFEIAVGLTLIGTFASIYHPVGIAWVVRHAVKRGKALGINGLFGNLGISAAALIAGAITDLIGWRAAFIIPGAVCVATGLVFSLFARSGQIAAATTDRAALPPVTRRDMLRALSVVAVASLCGGLVFQSISVGLPKVFDERGAGLVTGTLGIGGLVAVVYGVAGFAQIIVGHLIDKHAVKPVYVTIYLLEAPLLLAAAGLYDLPLLLVAVPFVFLNVGALPVLDSVVARYTPVEWRATIYGAKFVIGLGVSALGVPMVALIHDLTGGFTWLFVTLSGLALAIVAAGLFLPSERPAAPLTAAAGAPDQAD